MPSRFRINIFLRHCNYYPNRKGYCMLKALLTVFLLCQIILGQQTYLVKLDKFDKTTFPSLDKYGIRHVKPLKEGHFLEAIHTYPADLKVTAVYQYDLQNSFKISKSIISDASFRESILETYGLNAVQYLKSFSAIDSLDCIFSFCKAEKNDSLKYVIFDRNNDEDFSNDVPLTFETVLRETSTGRIDSLQIVTENVALQIFKNNAIRDTSVRIDFVEKQSKKRTVSYVELPYIYGGSLHLSGKEYFLAFLGSYPSIEIKPDDFLWIDLNGNRIFDYFADIFIQTNMPFTLDNVSYRIFDFDHFGKHLTIRKQDQQKYPPIAAGLPAPEFRFGASASLQTLLGTSAKRYILLDFWSCNTGYCAFQLNDIYREYKDKLDVTIILFNEQAFPRLPYDQFPTLKQVKTIVKDGDIRKLRYLYQITAEHWYVLIAPDGRIVLKDKFASEALKKFLKQNL